MRVLIIGAGEVGGHLARLLSRENHDIVVVDTDEEKVNALSESLDILAIHGNGTSPSTLREAGIAKMDMVIAVTTVDEVNILSCMIAKHFQVKTKIARIRNREFSQQKDLFDAKEMGIDTIIHPELEATNEIVRMIRYPQAMEIQTFCGGHAMIAGIKIRPGAPADNRDLASLSKLSPSTPFRLITINKNGRTTIPKAIDQVHAGDEVYISCLPSDLPKIFGIFGHDDRPTRNVMIHGATTIGRMVAEELENDRHIHVKLIESNREIGRKTAEMLDHAMVVVGDASDIDLISREGIIDMDVFCALTDDDETNIVTSLLARHLMVPKTITLTGKADYIPIVKTIGLDTAVNARFLTSNAIFKHIRHGDIVSLRHLVGVDAETIEFKVSAQSKVVGKQLKDIKFPEGSIVIAVEHEDGTEVPVGDTKIYVGDRVVLFSLPDAVKPVIKLFD